jgi:hypothetical protein
MLCTPECEFGTRRSVGGQPTHVIGVPMRKQHGVNVIDAGIRLFSSWIRLPPTIDPENVVRHVDTAVCHTKVTTIPSPNCRLCLCGAVDLGGMVHGSDAQCGCARGAYAVVREASPMLAGHFTARLIVNRCRHATEQGGIRPAAGRAQ